jgi:hypothetical protein
MQSESIARKVHGQTKPAPKLRLPAGQPLSAPELKKLRKFLTGAKAMKMSTAEVALAFKCPAEDEEGGERLAIERGN